MKKQFLIFLFFLPLPLLAQVTNVRAGQSGQDIVITYDLAESAEVRAYMSVGGQPFVELHSAQGDVGCVAKGTNRAITWSPLAESDEFLADNVVFKVEAPHAFVDLGLPSGTLWATCNVGANAPEEPGNLFAWGETTRYLVTSSKYEGLYGGMFFTEENYKYHGESAFSVSKYGHGDSFGPHDNLTQLELVDDAANFNWGGKWCMPTAEQWKELKKNCTWKWISNYNSTSIAGYQVVSKNNGNRIFLPVTGQGWEDFCAYTRDGSGAYWSSSLGEGLSISASGLWFDSKHVKTEGTFRRYGRSVRPVYNKK